jgi:hypothetical protein
VEFYLWLAQQSDLPADNSFPAVFEFLDNETARPDKGVIKAFLAPGYLEPSVRSGHLFFDLTPAGRSWLGQGLRCSSERERSEFVG